MERTLTILSGGGKNVKITESYYITSNPKPLKRSRRTSSESSFTDFLLLSQVSSWYNIFNLLLYMTFAKTRFDWGAFWLNQTDACKQADNNTAFIWNDSTEVTNTAQLQFHGKCTHKITLNGDLNVSIFAFQTTSSIIFFSEITVKSNQTGVKVWWPAAAKSSKMMWKPWKVARIHII